MELADFEQMVEFVLLTTAKNSLLTGDFATWISPDRGETWQQISSGENIYTINFQDASTGWGGEGQQLAHPTRMFQYTGLLVNDLHEKLILRKDWDGVGMLDLDLGACANGMYTVTLASNEGKAVRKVVVSR